MASTIVEALRIVVDITVTRVVTISEGLVMVVNKARSPEGKRRRMVDANNRKNVIVTLWSVLVFSFEAEVLLFFNFLALRYMQPYSTLGKMQAGKTVLM